MKRRERTQRREGKGKKSLRANRNSFETRTLWKKEKERIPLN
jgi:hypothetical protein